MITGRSYWLTFIDIDIDNLLSYQNLWYVTIGCSPTSKYSTFRLNSAVLQCLHFAFIVLPFGIELYSSQMALFLGPQDMVSCRCSKQSRLKMAIKWLQVDIIDWYWY